MGVWFMELSMQLPTPAAAKMATAAKTISFFLPLVNLDTLYTAFFIVLDSPRHNVNSICPPLVKIKQYSVNLPNVITS